MSDHWQRGVASFVEEYSMEAPVPPPSKNTGIAWLNEALRARRSGAWGCL